ncbi:MAG: hypothetical protein C4531_10265 [Desulfurivibrio sp.]|nr:MAG: hypothetical protein C4531_10265 [Desulfurivibrio sp.]
MVPQGRLAKRLLRTAAPALLSEYSFTRCVTATDMTTARHQSNLDRPLFPLALFLAVLAACIWATPLRDLFGLEAGNAQFIKNSTF